jgi:hypothetical protein
MEHTYRNISYRASIPAGNSVVLTGIKSVLSIVIYTTGCRMQQYELAFIVLESKLHMMKMCTVL